MYQPKHLQRWHELINYSGDSFDDFFIVHWRFFRCTPVERSNHKFIQDHLSDCGNTDGVEFVAFSDAIMLLRYYILVHKDNDRALRMADMLVERMQRKISLDPELEQRMQDESMRRQWNQATLKKRVLYCREAGISIFSARRHSLPTAASLHRILGDE